MQKIMSSILSKIKGHFSEIFFIIKNPKKKQAGIAPIVYLIVVAGIALAGYIGEDILEGMMGDIFNAIALAIFSIPLFLSAFAADVAGMLLTGVISVFMKGTPYTHSVAVDIGWPIVRDFANMMIVLGFIIVGIATALRIQAYAAKQLLVKLIIAALLINFSLLICGLFIDGSNIMMLYFFGKIGDAPTFLMIEDASSLAGDFRNEEMMTYAPKLMALTVFNSIVFFIYILYAMLLLARLVALWILVILSPLAFVSYVFPATKRIWNMWLNNFTQWCLIGIPLGFFLYLGIKIQDAANTFVLPPIKKTENISEAAATILTSIMSLSIPAIFLIVGFLVSLQFSAMGASSILGFANRTGRRAAKGVAKGTALGYAGVAGKSARGIGSRMERGGEARGGALGWTQRKIGQGFSAVGGEGTLVSKTRSAYGRGLEVIGGRKQGVTATADAKRLAEETAKNTALLSSGREKDVAKVVAATTGDLTSVQAVAAGQALHKDGKFGLVDKKLRIALADEASKRGVDLTSGLDNTQLASVANNNNGVASQRGLAVKELEKRDRLHLVSGAALTVAGGAATAQGMRIEGAERKDYRFGEHNEDRTSRLAKKHYSGRSFVDLDTDEKKVVREYARIETLDENIDRGMSTEQISNIQGRHITAKRLIAIGSKKMSPFASSSQGTQAGVNNQLTPDGDLTKKVDDAVKKYEELQQEEAKGEYVDQNTKKDAHEEMKKLLELEKKARGALT